MAEVELIDLVSDSEEEYDIDHVENILNEIENYDPASDKLKEGKKDSLLHRAVQYCLLPTIERVLKLKDVNVNARNGKRETPLHYAAKRDTKIHEVLKLLLRYGTNVEFLDDDGSSAFHVVVTNPEVCLFCLFLMTENNADINLQNKFGKTPLHCALEHGVCPTLTIKFMILFRANVKSVTIDGNYPLHSAVSSKYCSPEILQELAGFGSPVNAINNLGERPLHHALRNSNLNKESITELLALRASINAVNNDLVTPLCQAVIFECPLWVFDLFFFKGSLVNLGINIVQKAIELFNDEPSKERKEIVKMTIRLMLLESTDYNVRAMIAESNGPFELQEYAAECVQEIIAMDKLKTSNGRSFLEILVKEAPIVPVMNEVLKTLSAGKFPLYLREMGYFFSRKQMEDLIGGCEVHNISDSDSPNPGQKTTLYPYAVYQIMTFLKDDHDAFKMLVAFYPFKYPEPTPNSDEELESILKSNEISKAVAKKLKRVANSKRKQNMPPLRWSKRLREK